MERVPANDFDAAEWFGHGKAATVKHSKKESYINAWCAFDTETQADAAAGYIVAWSARILYAGRAVTVWGRTADESISFFSSVCGALHTTENRRVVWYVHNFPYDYMFLRNFLIEQFGRPSRSLAVKTHRYISMQFSNGLEFKDSFILAQCSLEKWARDLGASTQKAAGEWDYNKRRTPATPLSADEIDYACADAEALAECVRLKALQGGYHVGTIPLTATGFARDAARKAAFADDWQKRVHALDMTYSQYERCSRTFQGGITHGNRFEIGKVHHNVVSYDFASSYPFVMCTEKFPMAKWVRAHYTLEELRRQSADYAFMCDLVLIDARIKRGHAMPPIPKSKCTMVDNRATWDNGKLIKASVVAIPVNEIDISIYLAHYDYTAVYIGLYTDKGFARGDVYTCKKDYLPQWFVSTILHYFEDKTTKKGSDAQQYQYAKALLNSQYGMCAQRPVRPDIMEDFDAPAGEEWKQEQREDPAQQFAEYLDKYNYFLPYQWGMYVTSYARRNLYDLGACCGQWLYCDTDSVKGKQWNMDALDAYNQQARKKLEARGISPVEYNGRSYCMGVAEHDADYSEFITLGAKRYASRDAHTGALSITVAGVPKRGVAVLENDIYKFSRGLVFHDTGKLVPEYHAAQSISTSDIDGCAVRVGSWINLVPADYLLDMTARFDDLLDAPADEWEVSYT